MPYSTGVVCGCLTRLCKVGYFWKTHEGELLLEGLKTTGAPDHAATANVIGFSVPNPDVVQELKRRLVTQPMVCLQYDYLWFYQPWLGGTKRIVRAIAAKE